MVEERNEKDGYKQTEVGLIPEDWEVVRLGDIGESIIGLTYKPSDVRDSGTLVLRSSNIKDNRLDFNDNVFVQKPISSKLMIQKNDILVCVRNGSRNLIGKCAIIDNGPKEYSFGAFMSVFRSKLGKSIFAYFQSDIIKEQINNNLGATINQITNKTMNSFIIPIPSKPEELESIATTLTDTDNLLQSLQKLIDKKKKIKEGAMQELLVKKRGWETKSVKEIAFLHRNNIIPSSAPDSIYTYFSLPAFDMYSKPIIEEGKNIHSNKFVVPLKALLISKLNPRIPRIWKPEEIPNNSIASTEFIILTANNIDRDYLYVFCNFNGFIKQMELTVTGTTGSHQRVSPKDFMNLKVDFPSEVIEQKSIAKIISDIDSEIEALERKHEKLKAIKKGMMQELLTGRVRLV